MNAPNHNRLYFDHNATAPLAEGLIPKITAWLGDDAKNPSSVHQEGQQAKTVLDQARRRIKTLLGAGPHSQLVFTSGGTESNNMVLRSAWRDRGAKTVFVLPEIEHSCVHNTALQLEREGARLRWIKIDRNGVLDMASYQKALDDQVIMATAMLVNNETGFILPVKELAAMAREKNIPFFTDAVCAVGKWPVSFDDLGVDYLSFSSHKFGGLKGCGGLLYRQNRRLNPFVLGGPQESDKRAGTENVLGIAASAEALGLYLENLDQVIEKQKELKKRLIEGVRKIWPSAHFVTSEQDVSQTAQICFTGLNGQVLLTNLDLEGVAVSHGSACASGSLEVSRVLLNLGFSTEEAGSALRVSFGPRTTAQMIDDLLERLQRVCDRMAS